MKPDTPHDGNAAYRDNEIIERARQLLNEANRAAGLPPIRALCSHIVDDAHSCIEHHDGLRCRLCFLAHLGAVDHPIITECAICGLDTIEMRENSWIEDVHGLPVLHLDGIWRRFSGSISLQVTPMCGHCEDTLQRSGVLG